jgi:hypothetical protein
MTAGGSEMAVMFILVAAALYVVGEWAIRRT